MRAKPTQPPSLPVCSNAPSFALMCAQLPALELPDALLGAAVAIALHEHPDTSVEAIDRELQSYANIVRSRVRGDQPQAILAHLHELLFDELGFRGDEEDYQNPRNSFLPTVLRRKRGLPILLSLIYKIVGERAGLRVHGIGLPGHFVVAVENADSIGSTLIIDPFAAGRVLSAEDVAEELQRVLGDEPDWEDTVLTPVSNQHWITRMLQNLLHSYGASARYADVAAMLELEMLLWPEQTHLQRDLALVLARIDLSAPASMWLNAYLKANPDDPQRHDLERLLDVLTA